jgi:hypothetical protein
VLRSLCSFSSNGPKLSLVVVIVVVAVVSAVAIVVAVVPAVICVTVVAAIFAFETFVVLLNSLLLQHLNMVLLVLLL